MMRSKTRKIVALVFAALLSAVAFADTETVNGVTWTYLISNGEATIRNGYSAAIPESTSGALIIPSTLGGCPVTTIGDWAFYNCSSLTSVTIPEGVTTICSSAFYQCSSLIEVHITDLAKWCAISFADAYANPCCYSHHLYLKDEDIVDLVIPDGVTTIGYCAFFGCSSLTSVTIPDSVTTIGTCAFDCCRSLTSVMIPSSVTSIGTGAFEYCSSLTSVTIPESVTTIGYGAFRECSSLTSVTISEGVTTIGDSAFYYCSSLTSVTIPESVTTIGGWAFIFCKSLASVYVDCGDTERVRELMRGKGIDVDNLTFVEVEPPKPDGGPYKETVGSVEYTFFVSNGKATIRNGYSAAIPESTSGALIIPSTLGGCPVTTIGDWAFRGCDSLRSVAIPEGVTTIGSCAFYNCSSLTSVTIPEGVTTIGNRAFEYCSSLTSVTIPEGVTAIGDYAFRECNKITAVTIPASVTTITYRSFYAAEGIQNFTIAAANPNYLTNDGVIYTKDMKTLVSCPGAKRSVVVPSGVEMIGEGAFYYCSNLLSVTLPEELKEISDWAFAYCPSLAKLAIPSGMTTIGESAFSGDNDLASVTIPSSVTSVGSGAFWGCSALKTVHVEKGDTARIRSLMTGKGVDVNKLAFVEPPSRPAVVDGADESVKAAFDAWISRYGVTAPSAANVNAFILGLEPSATEEAIQKKVEEELANLDLGKLVEGNISAAVAEIQAKYPNAKVDLALVEDLNTSAHLYKLVIKLK